VALMARDGCARMSYRVNIANGVMVRDAGSRYIGLHAETNCGEAARRRSASGLYQVLGRAERSGRRTRILASTATQPSDRAMIGLRSSSATSGISTASRESR
jgi:hypothetical protein